MSVRNILSDINVSGRVIIASGTSQQFLKADGSLDNTQYLTGTTLSHLTLRNLNWTESGHIGIPAKWAGFDIDGNASYLGYNRVPINDTDYTISGITNQLIAFTHLTTKRNVYLPPATTEGQMITIIDENGDSSPVNRIKIHRIGTDEIDSNSYSILISPYVNVQFLSNGQGKWTRAGYFDKLSAGIVLSPSYVNNNDGSITIGDNGVVNLFKVPDGSGLIRCFEISGGTFTLTNSVTNYIVANYNANDVVVQAITDVTLINETTIIPLYTIYRGGNRLHLLDWDNLGLALVNKIHQSIVKTQRFRLESGLALGESSGRTVTITGGIVWFGANNTSLDSFASNVNQLFFCSHSGGTWTTSVITQYNNTQYDNGTNLVSLSPNRYAVNYIYRGVEVDDEAYMVLGQGNYTLLQAQASLPPANLPALITSHTILVGRIIVVRAAATAYEINSIFSAAFALSSTGSHNDLSGLQGGDVVGQYYHFNLNDYTVATQAATNTLSGYVTSSGQTFGGIKTFTGSPVIPTPALGDNSTNAASTAYVDRLNPLTNSGDIIYGGALGFPTRLGIGGANTVLHGGASSPSWSGVVEADIILSNNSTNNATTLRHGFLPLLSGNATQYLDGNGNFSTPSGSGSGSGSTINSFKITPFTSLLTVNVVHSFGTFPVVQVVDSTGAVIIPLSIVNNSVNDFTVSFTSATTGNIMATVGSPPLSLIIINSNYTVLITDRIIKQTSSGKIITLLTAVGNIAREYIINNSSHGSCIVNCFGSELINDEFSQILPAHSSMTVYSDGLNWNII